MKEIAGLMFLVALVVIALVGDVQAEDKKGPTCQDQLTETTVQAYNLDKDRDAKEQALAKSQVTIYQLQNQVAFLNKQLADAKKAMEQPKADDKKAE